MIILASTSRTRQALLANAGVIVESVSPNVDERKLVTSNPQWAPNQISRHLAKAKAESVSAQRPQTLVIGADQVLTCDDRVYNKPSSVDECRQQLLSLRGLSHSLITTVCTANNGTEIWSYTDTANLRMRSFTDKFLDTYLNTASQLVTTSVGGYQVEGLGIQLFETIDGDHFGILGLPLIPLLNHLRFLGALQS